MVLIKTSVDATQIVSLVRMVFWSCITANKSNVGAIIALRWALNQFSILVSILLRQNCLEPPQVFSTSLNHSVMIKLHKINGISCSTLKAFRWPKIIPESLTFFGQPWTPRSTSTYSTYACVPNSLHGNFGCFFFVCLFFWLKSQLIVTMFKINPFEERNLNFALKR